ncbi:MAG: UDP-N-acetylmuramoylalanine--D-glutamate ligase [Cyclobacteriaceae bacterium]|jgi:UDP-N-acetylmuramoylalanine--D-glutamate ligase
MPYELVILGSGESGMGAAHLAAAQGMTALVSDQGAISDAHKAELNHLGIPFEENGHSDKIFTADLIIKSPGIPESAKPIRAALAKGIEVISELEFGFRHLPSNAKVIGITGTNGKTTTTLLTHHLFKSAGFDVALAGNVGYSLAKRVSEKAYAFYIIEVSSFQLDNIALFRPDVAVLLNITPDHLDRYNYDFQEYVAAKFRITENLTQNEVFIYCSDSIPVTQALEKRKIEACLFAVSATTKMKQGAYMDNEHLIFDFKIKDEGKHAKIPLADIKLIGKHNMINSMAAVLTALTFDVPMDKIIRGLRSFENAPHRLEVVGEINGVRYINDSKATNVDAVYFALDGINQPIVWVAGGIDKGNDYSVISELVKEKVKAVICLGKDNSKLKKAFSADVKHFAETQRVDELLEQAQKWSNSGDVVLFSPACASFDLFTNYEERGNQFRTAVQKVMNHQKQKI